MIRKIIINMLLIACILNLSAALCFAREDTEFDYKRETLTGLGIISKEVDAESFVTRGEFIDIAVRLRNAECADGENIVFEDISTDYEYYHSIQVAAQYGIIQGDGARVNAGGVITASQVQTILLRVLGYTSLDQKSIDFISQKINSPYIKSGNYEMTWNMAINAVYDVLDVETVTPIPYGGNVHYDTTGRRLLEDYHDIYFDEGIVEGVGETLLTGESKTGGQTATINGKRYCCDDSKMRGFLGKRVRFYYKLADERIVFIREYKNDVLLLDGESIESYKDNQIGYEYNGKIKYAKISINADIVYNDRFSKSIDEKDITSENASVVLTDNDSDGYFDVIDVKKYDVGIVDGTDNEGWINLKYPIGDKLKIKPDDITDESLSEIDIREIMQNDVVCIYESSGGAYVKAVVCDSRISGTIESVTIESNKGTYAVINGERYKFSAECLKNQKNLIANKLDAIFTLDAGKKIAYINKYSDGFSFGYVIDVSYDMYGESVLFKLLTENNEIISMYVNEKAVLNGNRYSDINEFWRVIGEKNYRHRLIQYKLNSDNEIKIINDENISAQSDCFEKYYSDYEIKNGIMQKKNDNEKHYYKSYSKIIANRVSVSDNTIIMIVPDNASITDSRYYLCSDISYLVDDREYRVEAYRTSRESFTADALIIYDDVSSDYSISDQNIGISVLDNIFVTVNKDDEIVDGMELWDDGTKCSYPLRDNNILKAVYKEHTPVKGDIIRYSLRDGEINKLELIYSAADKTMAAPTSVTHKNDNNKYTQFRAWDAYVFYRWGTNIMLSDTMPEDYNNFDFSDYYTHSCAASNIIVCELSENGIIYTGNVDNLIGYKNSFGTECSRVVLYERYGEGKTIVIYK
ncbi:MAG: hypothetical protein SOS24_02660 [Clostridia bacterium]|nr:hypothetical protein [Clostridia bacterium]